jgi:DNA polymerase elongation subunit (family B)
MKEGQFQYETNRSQIGDFGYYKQEDVLLLKNIECLFYANFPSESKIKAILSKEKARLYDLAKIKQPYEKIFRHHLGQIKDIIPIKAGPEEIEFRVDFYYVIASIFKQQMINFSSIFRFGIKMPEIPEGKSSLEYLDHVILEERH